MKCLFCIFLLDHELGILLLSNLCETFAGTTRNEEPRVIATVYLHKFCFIGYYTSSHVITKTILVFEPK